MGILIHVSTPAQLSAVRPLGFSHLYLPLHPAHFSWGQASGISLQGGGRGIHSLGSSVKRDTQREVGQKGPAWGL